MAIFTRREIQKRLTSFIRIAGKRKTRQIVRLLNMDSRKSNEKRHLESLAAEWEIAVVSAFSELGTTKHEMKISNGKRPDIFFSDHEISLMCDVFAVSDAQQDTKNPVDEFQEILRKNWSEFGPGRGGLGWRVEAIDLKPPPPIPTHPPSWNPLHLSCRLRPVNRGFIKRLTLPPINGLKPYLEAKLIPWLKHVQKSPDDRQTLHVNEQYDKNTVSCFSITYNPKSSNITGSYPSYTSVSDMEWHILWRRLNEKRVQFSNAIEEVPRVLFICDNDCDALKTSWVRGVSDYHFDEVINHFWRRPENFSCLSWITEEGISAVVVLSVESTQSSMFSHQRDFVLKPRLFCNPFCKFPLDEKTANLLERVVSGLPIPVESPGNALHELYNNPISSRHAGGVTVAHNRFEMSGLDLLHILSGELSMDDFCRDHHLSSNPFRNALRKSQTIKSVEVEAVANRDDDKATFHFREYDTAIAPFKVPEDEDKADD